mmetsp:Transcript_45492/g.75849  ORF Transcript_45492/g.75849 Transcript_45492/m.75849 type:complete len:303 (+) Transcript_45492:838-1746(+)
MVVGAARHQRVPVLNQTRSHCRAVGLHLNLVFLELGLHALFERNGEGADVVVVGSPLQAGEHGGVDGVLEGVAELLALAEEDHATAGAAQRLVRGGGHHVGVLEGGVHHPRGHQPGDVRHVGHQVRTAIVTDLTHALVVVVAGIGGGARHNHLGAVQDGGGGERVVVNVAGIFVEPVRHGLEEDRGRRDALLIGLEAVGEMAAVRKVQSHDAVVRLQQTGVDGEVGGAAGQGLHVHAPLLRVQAKRSKRAALAQALNLVDVLVATVVTLSGKALRVFVGEAGPERFHHRLGGEVLRRNQLEP